MSDITAETIAKVLEISRPEIHDITDARGFDARYSTKQLFQVEAAAHKLPEIVMVSTLEGFADLIREEIEAVDFSEYLIHVENHRTVTLKKRCSDDYGRREVLVKAQPVEFDLFRFGNWRDQESFAIEIASKFADSPDKDYVLKMAATLTNDATSTTEDNGFTQRATVKAGLRMKESVTIRPRVALAPFRTFPEIEQPLSDFVFRARCTGEGVPALMLVEADGGRWKVDAIKKISEAMGAFNLEIPIIA